MIKILFICHGNICRSPAVEYIMKQLLIKYGLEATIDGIRATLAKEVPDFNIEVLSDKDKILERVQILIQRESDEPIIKRSSCYEGIEEYLVVKLDSHENETVTTKVPEQLVKHNNMSLEELWQQAEKNTFKAENIKITNMKDFMLEHAGTELSEVEEELYIITNATGIKGASQILNKQFIKAFLDQKGINPECAVFLPCSIHEALIGINMKASEISYMVKEANEMLDPEVILSDRAYALKI